jgi:D-amino-acid dehydrogenase
VASAGNEDIDADHIVIATGASSVPLLGTLGIRVPLYPLKGYSLTAPIDAGAVAPRISITDYERKMVYARLGDRLRIAGMADINGRRADVNPRRVATLRAAAAAMFPGAADFDRAVAWCGLRPATPKGLPIIDRTSFDNLWLNIGHGALGFTLALASGRLIGDLVSRRKPAISIGGFGLADT